MSRRRTRRRAQFHPFLWLSPSGWAALALVAALLSAAELALHLGVFR